MESPADPHIARFRANRHLNAAMVGHSRLGDAGCERLFSWLTKGDQDNEHTLKESESETIQNIHPNGPQFPRSIADLKLNDVGMGDVGFAAFVRWLESLKGWAQVYPMGLSGGKEPITKINLRCNRINGTQELAKAFVSALSSFTPTSPSSTIYSLVLSNNPLSPEFRRTLLSSLPSLPSLRQLYLSMTGLTRSDAKLFAKYFADEQGACKLVEFHANANSMNYGGVKEIVRAMKHSWTLERVEMYANHFPSVGAPGDDDTSNSERSELEEEAESLPDIRLVNPVIAAAMSSSGSGCGWLGLEVLLTEILVRNTFLKRQAGVEGLQLLKYSRILLRPEGPPPTMPKSEDSSPGDSTCISQPSTSSSVDPAASSHRSFHWLPTEIQLAILSSLAPILSSAQRIRIFEHAADRRTLPKLILCLPTRTLGSPARSCCVPDPASLAFGTGIISQGKKVGQLNRVLQANVDQTRECAGDTCMGSSNAVVCQSLIRRQKFLESVGCDVYDPAA